MDKNFTEMKGLCDRLELNDADVSDSHFENNMYPVVAVSLVKFYL
jgi:hypothetical protein